MIGLMMMMAFAQDESPGEEATVEAKAEARTLFENASMLYEEGDYDASLSALQKAYDLFPNAALKFNMANCLERLGRYDEALVAMNQYRAVAPEEERVTLERRIRAMEKRLEEEKAKPEPTAAPAPVVPAPVPTKVVKKPLWPLVGVGAGLAVAGGVGAGVSSGMASSSIKKLDRSSYGTARGLNAASFAVLGVGVGTAVLGMIVTKKKTVAVSVLPTPTGGQVAFGGTL